MSIQTITTPSGERLVVLSENDYERLVEAAEDNADRAAVKEFRGKLESGEEELLPSELVDQILGGKNPIKVWREYRGMTVSALAIAAGIGQSSLSQIELGKRRGHTDTLRRVAEVLKVGLQDLLGPEAIRKTWTPGPGDGFYDLLQPGVRLTTREIAQHLGVSVAHVNKTLSWRLQHGFVSSVPGSRPRRWMAV